LLPSSGSKSKPSNKSAAVGGKFSSMFLLSGSAGFLLGLLFDPEDGGNMLSKTSSFL
jgi:hypothetical protein